MGMEILYFLFVILGEEKNLCNVPAVEKWRGPFGKLRAGSSLRSG
jgi:hypothetical protein